MSRCVKTRDNVSQSVTLVTMKFCMYGLLDSQDYCGGISTKIEVEICNEQQFSDYFSPYFFYYFSFPDFQKNRGTRTSVVIANHETRYHNTGPKIWGHPYTREVTMTKSHVEKKCKNNWNTALKNHRPGDGQQKDWKKGGMSHIRTVHHSASD